jgi:hypothetical protein
LDGDTRGHGTSTTCTSNPHTLIVCPLTATPGFKGCWAPQTRAHSPSLLACLEELSRSVNQRPKGHTWWVGQPHYRVGKKVALSTSQEGHQRPTQPQHTKPVQFATLLAPHTPQSQASAAPGTAKKGGEVRGGCQTTTYTQQEDRLRQHRRHYKGQTSQQSTEASNGTGGRSPPHAYPTTPSFHTHKHNKSTHWQLKLHAGQKPWRERGGGNASCEPSPDNNSQKLPSHVNPGRTHKNRSARATDPGATNTLARWCA